MKNIFLLAALLAATSGPMRAADPDDQAKTPWQASITAEAGRDYDTALKEMAAYRQAGGDPFLFQLRTAWLHYLTKDYAAAAQSYRAAEQLAPGSINPLLGLLNVSLVQGDPAQIDAAAGDILKIDPLNYRALIAVAYQNYLAKNYENALASYRKILALYPDDVTARSGEAWCLLDLGHTSEAKADFQILLGLNSADAWSQQGLAAAAGKPTD